jgi:hypothetical protein
MLKNVALVFVVGLVLSAICRPLLDRIPALSR